MYCWVLVTVLEIGNTTEDQEETAFTPAPGLVGYQGLCNVTVMALLNILLQTSNRKGTRFCCWASTSLGTLLLLFHVH